MFDNIGREIQSFFYKNAVNGLDLGDMFYISRGWRILQSFDSFLANPLIGIGFGVPTPGDFFEIVYDPFFSLLSAHPLKKHLYLVLCLRR